MDLNNNSNALETLDCVSRQQNLQPTCNQLATDAISRQAAIDALMVAIDDVGILDGDDIRVVFDNLQSAQPTLMRSIGKLVGYTGNKCPNCGRLRVERYESGLEICEKCNWCEQTKSYWLDGV